MTLAGSCRCGDCSYVLDRTDMPVTYACHCLDCQTMTGSAFSLQAVVPLSRLKIEGVTIDWAHENSRGAVTTQRFCRTCKTRIYSTNEGRAGVAILRAGTLDDSQSIVPVAHMWVKRKQPWIELPVGADRYEESIPGDRAMTLFAPNFA